MQASMKAKNIPSLSKQAEEPKTTLGPQPLTSAATAKVPVRKRKAQESAPEWFTGTSEAAPGEIKKARHKASAASDASALTDALKAAKHPASSAAMHSRDSKQRAKGNQAHVPSKKSGRDKMTATNIADATSPPQQAARQPIQAAAARAPRHDSSQHAKSRREHASIGIIREKHTSQGAADASASRVLRKQILDGSGAAERKGAYTAGENDGAKSVSDDDDLSADIEDSAAQTNGGAADSRAGAGAERPKLTEEQRQERLQRTMFVGNLPAAVKAKRLKQTFARCACWSHLHCSADVSATMS